jgi:hypothetical protein
VPQREEADGEIEGIRTGQYPFASRLLNQVAVEGGDPRVVVNPEQWLIATPGHYLIRSTSRCMKLV